MPQSVPYGDAFLVQTPKLDEFSNRLYAEQKQRELNRQRENAALDEEFSKNLATIRDADIPDLTKSYSDWKMATQQMMKQKGGISPTQQMEVLRKKADMYKLINESKAEKENEKVLGKAIMADKTGIYDDKAHARLRAKLGLPLSQQADYTEIGDDGKPVSMDLRDDHTYLYKLGTTDFSKIQKLAEGSKRPLNQLPAEVDPNDPMKQIIKGYEGGNNPYDYYNTLLSGIAGQKANKDFVLKTNLDYTPEKVKSLEDAYNKLVADPKYQKIYGLSGSNQFPASAYNTDVGNAARIKAMEYALNNPPIEKVTRVTNQAKVMATRFNQQQFMEALRQNNRVALAGMRRNWQVLDQQAQNDILDGVVNDYVKNPTQIPEDILNSYKKTDDKGHKVDFESVKVSPDGTKVQMIVKDSKGNADPTFSAEASIADLKERTRKKIETAQTNTHVAVPAQSQSTYTNIQPGTHNGKKVTIGYKNGKWYDTKTGQEIK